MNHITRQSLIFAVTLLFSMASYSAEPVVEKAAEASYETLSAGNIVQMMFGLLVVLLMIFGSAWLMKRFGRFQGGIAKDLKVLGGVPLGARERVVLIQVGEKQVLIGVAPGCIQTLHVLEKPLDVTASVPESGQILEKFSAILNKQKQS